MTPVYEDLHFRFRFADIRIIPRFHLEGVEAGQHVSVFKIAPGTSERLGLAIATVGEGAWVGLGAIIGTVFGERLLRRIPEPVYHRFVVALVLALGIFMLFQMGRKLG